MILHVSLVAALQFDARADCQHVASVVKQYSSQQQQATTATITVQELLAYTPAAHVLCQTLKFVFELLHVNMCGRPAVVRAMQTWHKANARHPLLAALHTQLSSNGCLDLLCNFAVDRAGVTAEVSTAVVLNHLEGPVHYSEVLLSQQLCGRRLESVKAVLCHCVGQLQAWAWRTSQLHFLRK